MKAYFDITDPTPCDYCKYYEWGCEMQVDRDFLLNVDFIINNKDECQCLYFKMKEPKLMFEIEEKEMIDHPRHYNMGKYEAIDVIDDWGLGFNLGNVVKYISRAGHKDDILQDLKKSLWYLQREIQRIENKGE